MPNPNFTQYDPGLVILTLAGKLITGFSDGTMIEVERETDAWTKTVGGDGEVTRTKSQNYSGSIKITLLQGSPGNDILSALATQDEQTSDAIFPVLLKETGGNSIAQGAKAWIKKKANLGYSKDPENREWTIDVAQLSYDVGGNILL